MAKSPVLLVLGAGSNVGLHVTRIFREHGYKTAVAARSLSGELERIADLSIKVDLGAPKTVPDVFKDVVSKLGSPNVVVYNASAKVTSAADDPFALDFSEVSTSLNVNFFSAYVAAQEAVKAFKMLPDDMKKTFIFTGNMLNLGPIQGLLAFGAGKTASAHMIANASMSYQESGYRFYYTDQRTSEGVPLYQGVDGPAHATYYWKLANDDSQGPWDWTFVKDKGYVDFGVKG